MNCAGLAEQADVVDMLEDGSCGCYSVLYGLYLQGHNRVENLLSAPNGNFQFCTELAWHLENDKVLKQVLELPDTKVA